MADPVVTLDTQHVSVQPGGQAQVVAKITSNSSIVEGFRLQILGAEPARWAEVVPPSVDVYPGEEATAAVVFSPPSGPLAPSGVFAFGLLAISTENPDDSAVAEAEVELTQVLGLQAKIIPVTSSGRWRGRHVIQLSNWGNTPAHLHMVASDPDNALGFYLRPDLVELPIGSSATIRLSVRTRRPFLRGPTVRLPFQVVGERAGTPSGPVPQNPYGDPGRPVVDGALNQKAILPKAVVTIVALLVVAGIAGGVWLFNRSTSPTGTQQPSTGPSPQPSGPAMSSGSGSTTSGASGGPSSITSPAATVTPSTTPSGETSTTPPTTTSTSKATPTDVPAGQWIIVANIWPHSKAPQYKADELVAALHDAAVPTAFTLDTARYVNFRIIAEHPLAEDSWVAAVGPYPTQDAATRDKARVMKVAGVLSDPIVMQPGPLR
jgi:hypothetical protein